ncbi:hypothetical protein FT663_05145 [Candidozyma haemuli var. vulneris]|uniref:peptidylprolyl isomerase n=1 Tax=Candidozyma haemuli TaxID=45357 RepID=A0A2V1AZG5_9ASCO|nr:hypothetical protein CXQ85_002977 [[Candida] haemuloni]KAF3985826.1 hypothetical protein FT663_05145 [[Candida] haemuloni var. vulneris]KAF3991408.1 hypothetical protein FT662_01763 [[Candida] haemuloni var. vulneris]PVH23245.1 hypothetical protein CXQ85_002977 [[Candida] haemuloni]
MSVFFETNKGNLVVDLEYSNPCFEKDSFLFVALAHLNEWLLSEFEGFDKNVSLTGPEVGVPVAVQRLLERKELKNGSGDVEETAPPGSVEVLNSDGRFQFQVNLAPKTSKRVVGRVAEGLDVLDDVNKGDGKLRILHSHVVFDPFSMNVDSLGSRKSEKDLAPETIKKVLKAGSSGDDDEASVEALALELLGDLSHYKVKPSPETLFVARLNPITTENSLEVIFSRFGTVRKAQILSGKKIKYAFVEFTTKEAAEEAYTQLHDNCSIDGHQVLVDFSQSTKNKLR